MMVCVILGMLGSIWMIFVLHSGSLRLAFISNYPGMVTANHWIQYKGIAPPSEMIWLFDVWLVLTSGLLWIAVGLVIRVLIQSYRSTRSLAHRR